jgi:hypothetical protein
MLCIGLLSQARRILRASPLVSAGNLPLFIGSFADLFSSPRVGPVVCRDAGAIISDISPVSAFSPQASIIPE